jgi:hypothetical protein
MHPDVPRANLAGFSNMTGILAFVATKNLSVGGAYMVR